MTPSPKFDAFFSKATSTPDEKPRKPYDYQCRLACGPHAKVDQPETLTTSTGCHSQLINTPIGA